MSLETFLEDISDEFGSTFSLIDENTIANMLMGEDEFPRVTGIIQKYIPNCKVEYIKTGQFGSDDYDLYMVRVKEKISIH